MMRVRRLVSTIALSAAWPSPWPAATRKFLRRRPRHRRRHRRQPPRRRHRRHRRRRRRQRRPRRCAERRRDLRAQVGRSAERGKAAGRRVLRPRQVRVRDDAKPALQKDADWMKKWTSIAGHARRALRLARQRRVQPRPRHPPRHRGEGLPGQPRRAGQPRSPWSARARNSRSAATRTNPAGSRTAAATS